MKQTSGNKTFELIVSVEVEARHEVKAMETLDLILRLAPEIKNYTLIDCCPYETEEE